MVLSVIHHTLHHLPFQSRGVKLAVDRLYKKIDGKEKHVCQQQKQDTVLQHANLAIVHDI